MRRLVPLLALLLLIPLGGSAATFAGDKTLVFSEVPDGNAYLSGTNVRVSIPLPEDLAALAGTLVVSAPVAGDVLIAGGTLDVQAPIAGDVRALGGQLLIAQDIGGDLVALGGNVTVSGKARHTHVAGGTVELRGGANGPVTVYGANVYLAGEFAGDVSVVASDHVTIGEGTTIHGVLRYNAPQEAAIPDSATITGEVSYTGSSAFLPTVEEAKTFALAGAGVFFIVGLLSGLLAAGLLTGLFPQLAQQIAERALFSGIRKFLLLFLLGFALLVATPVLLILLFVSFVGAGVALVVGAAYLLLLALSYLYAAVLAGAALARAVFKRSLISWKDAVLGMLVLQLITILPFGALITFILSAAAAGALSRLAFSFAFPRGDSEIA